MMNKKKWIGNITMLLLIFLSLAACDKDKENPSDQTSEYEIYYINSKTSEIVSEKYYAVSTTSDQLIEELLKALRVEPKNVVYKKALPDNVTIKDFTFSKADGQITINFDSNYNDLVGIPEVLCRAIIVKTLSQIPGLEYVVFSVSGQPLKDSSENVVKLMTEDDFIQSSGAETSYKVSLFFANEDGDALVKSEMNMYYTGSDSIEELVIKQLINGPIEKGFYDTIPEGTTLLNVTTKEGICYVDFNEKFLEKISAITDDVAIYSVVNSLVGLPDINKVQFYINGDVRQTFRDNTVFDGLFERNLSIIEGSE